MDVSRDFEELFGILNTYRIKYLVVGGQAVIFYTKPRFTKDIDVWIPPELNNVNTVFEALTAFGAPLKRMTPQNFLDKTMIFQIGVAPVRIDIMISVPGISYNVAWKKRKKTRYGKTWINLVSISDLIKTKEHAGRPQDKLDLILLKDIDKSR